MPIFFDKIDLPLPGLPITRIILFSFFLRLSWEYFPDYCQRILTAIDLMEYFPFFCRYHYIYKSIISQPDNNRFAFPFVSENKYTKNPTAYAIGFLWVQGPDLNRRPPGYEPDELPDCSTLRYIKLVPETGIEPVREINPTGF